MANNGRGNAHNADYAVVNIAMSQNAHAVKKNINQHSNYETTHKNGKKSKVLQLFQQLIYRLIERGIDSCLRPFVRPHFQTVIFH